jgi:metal-responsive CopG/Arc/MetJ family transcriptional regulator
MPKKTKVKIEKSRLCVTISKSLHDKIDEFVDSQGIDKSKLVEVILNSYINSKNDNKNS